MYQNLNRHGGMIKGRRKEDRRLIIVNWDSGSNLSLIE